jgi:hypothetical protein
VLVKPPQNTKHARTRWYKNLKLEYRIDKLKTNVTFNYIITFFGEQYNENCIQKRKADRCWMNHSV